MPGRVKRCRICNNREFQPVLDLGNIPPVDNFLTEKELKKPETHYPLETVICDDCGLVQLNYIVPKEKLFHGDYAYDMSVTDAGVEHFHNMAEEVYRAYPNHNSVLDIGSNTGVLLEGFKEQGCNILGIEPSSNVYELAVKRGIPTRNEFFSETTAENIRKQEGAKDIVTATNVFAHIEDLHGAVRGIKTLLGPNGVFIFEVPYLLDLVENNEFDTIYHEHRSYFSVKPLVRLFDQHNMEIINIEKQKIHGGSLRVHVARQGEHERTDAVDNYLRHEQEIGLHSDDVLNKFREHVEHNRRKLVELMHELHTEGYSIAGVGAPAKGVTLLNYCNLNRELVPYVSEKSELKIGSYVPGTHNEVVSDRTLLERQPDYALLLPWNFAESIIENLEEYLENGGKFIIPVPEPLIIESKDQL